MHTMTTPAHEMVEIEQNQETGEVPTANGVPLTTAKEWREQVRDWWYSIQDLLAEKDVCLHERKRVEIERIIKNALDQHSAHLVERIEKKKKKTELDRSSLAIGMQEYWHNQALDQAIDIVKTI